MKLLLDTATILWISYDATKLSATARNAYSDSANDLYLSVATIWEIIVKNRLGKLPLPGPVAALIDPLKHAGVHILPLTESATYRLLSLPDIHRDPFDRMLICQAIDKGLTLVTPDATLSKYPIPTLW